MPKMSHIEITRLQGGLAIASFASGVLIAMVCLFWIEPLGEITYSAISIVSELLPLRRDPRREGILRHKVPQI